MEILTGQRRSSPETTRLPAWLWICGLPVIFGAVLLTGRIVWEETALTWNSGPQMLGFSLAHGIGAVLFLFPLLLSLWALVATILATRNWITKRANPKPLWVMLALAACVLGVLALPYGFWQRLFVDRLVRGPYTGEFLSYAAATGDLGTVKALISRGVRVDQTDREGRTGLHAASATGRMRVLRYLLSHSADINALNLYGDSPLEVAASRGQKEAATFLTDHGAKRIRGDDAQRYKATEAIVGGVIKQMH